MSVRLRVGKFYWRFVRVRTEIIQDGKDVDWWHIRNSVSLGFGWYFIYKW